MMMVEEPALLCALVTSMMEFERQLWGKVKPAGHACLGLVTLPLTIVSARCRAALAVWDVRDHPI
jgi:hypothetical protein